ncbi:MAG: hypothetical protein ACR2QF_02480 [Geminicoccaceae bacterium]
MASGFGLGGFGEGLTRGFGTASAIGSQIVDRSLRSKELQESKATRQQAAQQKAEEAARKTFRDDVKTVTDLVDQAAGRSPAAARRVVEQLTAPNSRGMSQIDILAGRANQLGVGLSSEMIARDLQARVAAAVTPEDRRGEAVAEAETEVATTAAQARGIQALPKEVQDEVSRKLGFTDTSKGTEFLQLLDEADRLRGAGQTDTSRFRFLTERLGRLTKEQGGFEFTFDPESNQFRLATGGAAGAGVGASLPATQQFTQQQRVAGINTTVATIDDVLSRLEDEPQDFGIVGSLRKGSQEVVGVLQDIAGFLGESDAGGVAQAIADSIGQSLFDEDLPELNVIENDLALDLAKLRLERSGGNIRALGQVFRQAKDDVGLTGLTSGQAVRDRLKRVKKIFEAEREALVTGLSGRSTSAESDLTTLSDEELEAEIARKQKRGPR